MCRTEKELAEGVKEKLSIFCNVENDQVNGTGVLFYLNYKVNCIHFDNCN